MVSPILWLIISLGMALFLAYFIYLWLHTIQAQH